MKKPINITISEYVLLEYVGETKNRSARIEELVIKGFHSENNEKLKNKLRNKKKSVKL
jgi:hypothetical protein